MMRALNVARVALQSANMISDDVVKLLICCCRAAAPVDEIKRMNHKVLTDRTDDSCTPVVAAKHKANLLPCLCCYCFLMVEMQLLLPNC